MTLPHFLRANAPEDGQIEEGDGLLNGKSEDVPMPASTRPLPVRKDTGLTIGLQCYIALTTTVLCCILLFTPTSTSQTPPVLSTESTDDNAFLQSFSRDFRYMSLDHRYDDLWQYSNMSALTVLEPELDTGEQVDAAISMFHQLHCLSSFRTALQDAYEGHPVAFDYRENGHWPHCLDYLRKAILCAADGTLELPKIVDGRRTEVIDGAHDKHQCRPNQALFDLQESSQT